MVVTTPAYLIGGKRAEPNIRCLEGGMLGEAIFATLPIISSAKVGKPVLTSISESVQAFPRYRR
jgi:hypothetical protein